MVRCSTLGISWLKTASEASSGGLPERRAGVRIPQNTLPSGADSGGSSASPKRNSVRMRNARPRTRQYVGGALLALLVSAGGSEGAAMPRPSHRRTTRQELRPATGVRPASAFTVEMAPKVLRLEGARAEQGLIVTAVYPDGTRRDVSSAARYRVVDPTRASIAREGVRWLVRPRRNGDTHLEVSVPPMPAIRVRLVVRGSGEPAPISFRGEVVPALTKAGCNQGTCHGTPTGKGGFRLSLQGYAPDADYAALVREGSGRRVNRADPGRSLLLLKPLVAVPHAGGRRLAPDMPEYRVLSQWIAEGAAEDPADTPTLVKLEVLPGRETLSLPGARRQIAAIAHFSDGTRQDITRVAKLTSSDDDLVTVTREGRVEGRQRGDAAILVRYQHLLEAYPVTLLRDVPGFRWDSPRAENYVDRHVYARLRLFQIPASALCTDTEFVRRAYLDLLGRIPSADEVRAFFAGAAGPGARARLVETLLSRPEFPDFWALKWADVLRIQDETLRDPNAKAYHGWVRDSLATNKPLDQFARELLTASGGSSSNPPVNYFRTLQEPQEFAEATAQLFMGVRMTCARCHNHPFERWTQDEYYQFAAFFSQVQRRGAGRRRDAGEETIGLNEGAEVTHLRTGKIMQPRLPGAGFPAIRSGDDRRVALADWLVQPANPFFARAMANRIWSHLLGRGIVEPVDDFRESNPPVNGPLLAALARDLADHGFDQRHLIRTIMASRTYQLSSRAMPLNRDDETYFSHALVRAMSAEQLADSLSQFAGVPDTFAGYPKGTRAAQLAGTRARTPFLKTFGRPDRNLNCECEREKEPTLFQALTLLTGRQLQSKLRADDGRVAALAASGRAGEVVLEELYLSALARKPSTRERQGLLDHLTRATDRRAALEDIAWALLNSKEFLFRR